MGERSVGSSPIGITAAVSGLPPEWVRQSHVDEHQGHLVVRLAVHINAFHTQHSNLPRPPIPHGRYGSSNWGCLTVQRGCTIFFVQFGFQAVTIKGAIRVIDRYLAISAVDEFSIYGARAALSVRATVHSLTVANRVRFDFRTVASKVGTLSVKGLLSQLGCETMLR